MTQHTQQERFQFTSKAFKDHSCKVVRFSGTEGLNTLYSFDITLVTQSFIDVRPFIISPCTLTIHRGKEPSVHFHGYPASCAQGTHINGWTFYTVRMVPQFSKLSGIVHNAIYLNKNVQEIVEKALKHCGPIKPAHSFQLLGTYPKQEFSMQYNEDVYSYICYFLEREGIYYYFDQNQAQEKVIFTDAPINHMPIMGQSSLTYSPTSGLEGPYVDEVVVSFSKVQSPLPKYVFVRDYDWQNPNVPIEAKALVDTEGLGDLFFYGDGFTSTKEGERLAKIRAEALRCKGCVYHGTSSVPRLSPGYVFSLKKHFDPSCNADYTITHVQHEGSQEGYLSMVLGITLEHPTDSVYYRNTFSCIEKDLAFRAAHKTERKKISGMIHAFVDKASSSNIPEIDGFGRYKVVFPQDISGRGAGKASCWLRRAQPSVGMGYGTSFPLDAGVEVLISFTDGNPDRPFIASAIANKETGTVDSAASALFSGITTAGGGGLTFNDNGEKQGLNLTTGSGRSGLFMASGSLDSTVVETDNLSTISTTFNVTLASLLNLFSSRVQTKVYVTGNPTGFDISKMVIKELTNISKAATTAATMAGDAAAEASEDASLSAEERLEAQETANNSDIAELSWTTLTDLLTLAMFTTLQTQNFADIYKSWKNPNPPSPYVSILGTGGNNGALSLQSRLDTKLTATIIAEAVASLTARMIPVTTAAASNKIDKQDMSDEAYAEAAQKDVDSANAAIHTEFEAQRAEAEKQFAAGAITEEEKNVILATYSTANEAQAQTAQKQAIEQEYNIQKANKIATTARNYTTTITPLLTEFMTYVMLLAKKDGIWGMRKTPYGGVKIKSSDANVAITSALNTHVSSKKSISLIALDNVDSYVDTTQATTLSTVHDTTLDIIASPYICHESEQICHLAHKDMYSFAQEKATLHAGKEIFLTNNTTRTNTNGAKSAIATVPAAPAVARDSYSSLQFLDDTCTLSNTGTVLKIVQNTTAALGGTLKIERKEGTTVKNGLDLTSTGTTLSFENQKLELTADAATLKHTKDILLDAAATGTIKAPDVILDASKSIAFKGSWGNISGTASKAEVKAKGAQLKIDGSGTISIG